MWKYFNNQYIVGIVVGAGGNGLWAALSKVSALKPYLPSITAPVQVPMWTIVGIAGIALVMGLRLTVRIVRRTDNRGTFVPDEIEMAIVVFMRAEDRPLPDESVISLVTEHSPDHIGREDVRVALRRLHEAGWLTHVRLPPSDILGNALTTLSLNFARRQHVKPFKRWSA